MQKQAATSDWPAQPKEQFCAGHRAARLRPARGLRQSVDAPPAAQVWSTRISERLACRPSRPDRSRAVHADPISMRPLPSGRMTSDATAMEQRRSTAQAVGARRATGSGREPPRFDRFSGPCFGPRPRVQTATGIKRNLLNRHVQQRSASCSHARRSPLVARGPPHAKSKMRQAIDRPDLKGSSARGIERPARAPRAACAS